jgi:hypothetical protein
MALPIVRASGCNDHARVAPPGPAEKVCVSSTTSSVPAARVNDRTAVQ